MTDGIASAIEQAMTAAGDKNVVVMGGADVCSQTVAEGLADEIVIHVAPVLVGAALGFDHLGTDPIPLEITQVVDSPGDPPPLSRRVIASPWLAA